MIEKELIDALKKARMQHRLNHATCKTLKAEKENLARRLTEINGQLEQYWYAPETVDTSYTIIQQLFDLWDCQDDNINKA